MIAERCAELNAGWSKNSPEAHVRWMPPAPYILDELPKRERDRLLRSMGRTPEGDWNSLMEYDGSPRRRSKALSRLDFQRDSIEPLVDSQRCAASRRIAENPRRAVEERVLRGLIFCSEVQRLDGLDKLLAIMVGCEEKELKFWTSVARQELFSALSDVEGELTPEEIAGQLENAEWWSEDIEDLFLPDDGTDGEWKEVRDLDLADPVRAVESGARAIEHMEKRIRGRLAVDEMDESIRGALNAREKGDFVEMDAYVAKQILLKSAVNESSCLSPIQLERQKEEEEEAKRELELKAQGEKILERLMRGEDIPMPEHLLRMEDEGEAEEE